MAATWIRGLSAIEIPTTVIEETEDRKVIQRYTPMGVAGAIVPWNFPVLLAVGKIVPAVYTGNAVVVKPSPFTPYCDLKLAELATRFFPPGVVQCLSGDDTLGPMMTEHPGIDKISFTGSIATGKRVMASCAKTLKRVTLELGGNDPAIVCDDVDIDAVIPKVGPPLHGHGKRTQTLMRFIDWHSLVLVYLSDLHDDQTSLCTREYLRPVLGEVDCIRQDPQGRRGYRVRRFLRARTKQDAIRKGQGPLQLNFHREAQARSRWLDRGIKGLLHPPSHHQQPARVISRRARRALRPHSPRDEMV